MPYPSTTEVERRAVELWVDPIVIYAYAALHGRTPTDQSVLQAFTAQVEGWMRSVGVTDPGYTVYLYDWIQTHGGYPPSAAAAVVWMGEMGYWDAARQVLTGKYPAAGRGYPPGGATTSPGPLPTPTPVPVSSGGFDLSALFNWVKAHPLQTGGVIVGYLLLSKRR